MTGIRLPAGARNFSPRHRIQTGSGAHLTSCSVAAGGFFPWR